MKSKTRNTLTCKLVVTQNQLCDVRQRNCEWREKEVSLWTRQLRVCIYFSWEKKKPKQNRKVILSTPVTWFMCIVTNKQEKLKTEGHITYSSALLFHIFVTASDTTWRVLLTDTAIISGNPWKSSWLNTGKYTLLPEWKQSLKGFCSIRSESSVFKKKKVSPQFHVQLKVVNEGKAGRRKEETGHPPWISSKIWALQVLPAPPWYAGQEDRGRSP